MSTHLPAGSRVVVGLSGGVDSSVAALLLQQQGYEVHGLFMLNWEEDEEGYCTAAEDFQEARRVCEQLSIPLHRADFSASYRQHVFAHFLAEYARGRTPNPDVLCNREIKFGAFLQHALRLGASAVATGHYARLRYTDAGVQLLRGVDPDKDQSYFLHAVSGAALAQTLFPIGELRKSAVRRIALEHGLSNHARRDSTGICFIGERPFRDFLGRYLPDRPGPIVTTAGQEIGRHRGLLFYTLGQRQGLGLGGQRGFDDAPWYVVRRDAEGSRLFVAQEKNHPWLLSSSLESAGMHWIAGAPSAMPFDCQAQVRYRQKAQSCSVRATPEGCHISFAQPQRAVATGQYVVLYRNEECLGGGTIEAVHAIPGVVAATDEAPA